MGTTVQQTPGIVTRSNLYAQAVTLPKPVGKASSLGTLSTGIRPADRSSVLDLQAVPVLEANPLPTAEKKVQVLKANYQALVKKDADLKKDLKVKEDELDKLVLDRDAESEAKLAPSKKALDDANKEKENIMDTLEADDKKIFSNHAADFQKIDAANQGKDSIELGNLHYAAVKPERDALYAKHEKLIVNAIDKANTAYDKYTIAKKLTEDEISAKYKPLIAAKDAEIEAVRKAIKANDKELDSTSSGSSEARELAVKKLYQNPPFTLKPQ